MFSQLVGSGGSTFNSLNAYIVKGDTASGMNLTFASLMARAFDEPDAVYLLAAEELTVSPDGLIFRFRLPPGIVFHDGSEITLSGVLADDAQEQGTSDLLVRASRSRRRRRRDKRTVAPLPSDARSRRTGARGGDADFFREVLCDRPFDETSLEAPLGSGPYRVARFEQGRYVEFERVKNWWGEKLPVSRGLHNFDTLRDEVLPGSEAGFEAFTDRELIFPRRVLASRVSATHYDFPALRDGRVKRDVIPDERPSGARAGCAIPGGTNSGIGAFARR